MSMGLQRTIFEIVLYVILPAGLTWIACLWLFYLYFKTKEKTLGLKMICILGVSDFLFSTSVIVMKTLQSPLLLKLVACFFYGGLYFSVTWASAMSFIVFKSLENQAANPEILFKRTLGIILATIPAIGLILGYFDGKFDYHRVELIVIPIGVCILCTYVYYTKSANLMKLHSDYELRSTKLYIKTLKAYSLAHLVTFTPSLVFLIFLQRHPELSAEKVSPIWGSCEAFTLLAGFINTLIYVRQRLVTQVRASLQRNDDLSVDLLKVDQSISHDMI